MEKLSHIVLLLKNPEQNALTILCAQALREGSGARVRNRKVLSPKGGKVSKSGPPREMFAKLLNKVLPS
jgi:hypothetical protein